jgi:prefoldin subunit 5
MKEENLQQLDGVFNQLKLPKDLGFNAGLGGIQEAMKPLKQQNFGLSLAEKFNSPFQKIIDDLPAFQMAEQFKSFSSPFADLKNDHLYQAVKNTQISSLPTINDHQDIGKIVSETIAPNINHIISQKAQSLDSVKELQNSLAPLIETQKKIGKDFMPLVNKFSKLEDLHLKLNLSSLISPLESSGYFEKDLNETLRKVSDRIEELTKEANQFGEVSFGSTEEFQYHILTHLYFKLTPQQFKILKTILPFLFAVFYPLVLEYLSSNEPIEKNQYKKCIEKQKEVDSFQRRIHELEKEKLEKDYKNIKKELRIDSLKDAINKNKINHLWLFKNHLLLMRSR